MFFLLRERYAILINLVTVLTLLLMVGRVAPVINFLEEYHAYALFHLLIELLVSGLLVAVATICLMQRSEINELSRLKILGMGCFWLAILEMGHALSYKGMPTFITPNGPEKAINFWLVSRFMFAGLLLALAFMKPKWQARQSTQWLCFLGMASVVVLTYWIFLFHPDVMPRTFIPGTGLTSLKITLEYMIGGLFIAAALASWWVRRDNNGIDFYWLAGAAWVQMLADCYFTLYANVNDLFNVVGHFYVIIGLIMMIRAIKSDGLNQVPLIQAEHR